VAAFAASIDRRKLAFHRVRRAKPPTRRGRMQGTERLSPDKRPCPLGGQAKGGRFAAAIDMAEGRKDGFA
jgi:hypothetical protein